MTWSEVFDLTTTCWNKNTINYFSEISLNIKFKAIKELFCYSDLVLKVILNNGN